MSKKLLPILAVILFAFTGPAVGQDVELEKAAIVEQTKKFSAAYIEGDISSIMECFEDEARIVPVHGRLLAGHGNIKDFWAGAAESPSRVVAFDMVPEELVVEGSFATSIGYYSGEVAGARGRTNAFGGTFVTVWKKSEGVWRMQHSMWRAVKNFANK